MARQIGVFEEKGYIYRNTRYGSSITTQCETSQFCPFVKISEGLVIRLSAPHKEECIGKAAENRINAKRLMTVQRSAAAAVAQAAAETNAQTAERITAAAVAAAATAAAASATAAAASATAAAASATAAAASTTAVANSAAAAVATVAAKMEETFWARPDLSFHILEYKSRDSVKKLLTFVAEERSGLRPLITLPWPVGQLGDDIQRNINLKPFKCEIVVSGNGSSGIGYVLEIDPNL